MTNSFRSPPADLPRTGSRGLVQRALRLPLLYKILAANAAIVVLGAVGGTFLTAELVRRMPERSTLELVGELAIVGVFLSVVVNALILRLALSPLREVEDTARAVEAGDLSARATPSAVADRDLERLVRVLNDMLDRFERHQENLRVVARRALTAAEEERRRIAGELHDDTAQRLALLMVRLRTVRNADDPEEIRERLDAWREELADTLEAIRAYARGLRPPALDELGVVAAVEALARKAGEAGCDVEVEVDGPVRGVGPDAELALYRMIQEALSNAVRHAGSDLVEIRMGCRDGDVVARIVDRGAGFDVDAVLERGDGLGLIGLRERALYVDGSVSVESTPGEGTTVEIRVPADHDAPPPVAGRPPPP